MIFLIDLYIIKRVVKNYIIIHIIQIIVHLNILIILSLMNNICIVIQNVILIKQMENLIINVFLKRKQNTLNKRHFYYFYI